MTDDIVQIYRSSIFFDSISQEAIILKDLTPAFKYEKVKLENHFYEMLTATVSHDMRTPLNAMLGLINSLELFLSG